MVGNKPFRMGGKIPFTTTERVFFAENHKKAVAYARKVWKDEGQRGLDPNTIHLAKKQNPNTSLKTWTGKYVWRKTGVWK